MLNREQRRRHEREIKKVKFACNCPECGEKTRFIGVKNKGEETALMCEVCGKFVWQGENITRTVRPGYYLPMTLNQLSEVIKQMKEDDAKRQSTEEPKNSPEEEPKENQRYGSKVYPKRNY